MPQPEMQLLVAGYPCQKNSRMNPDRFNSDAADSVEADVLVRILQLVRTEVLRPRECRWSPGGKET